MHFETRLNQWDFAAQRENRDAVDVVQTIALDIPSVEDAQATND